MLWDRLKTLITLRMTLQTPCMCAGCKRGRDPKSAPSIRRVVRAR